MVGVWLCHFEWESRNTERHWITTSTPIHCTVICDHNMISNNLNPRHYERLERTKPELRRSVRNSRTLIKTKKVKYSYNPHIVQIIGVTWEGAGGGECPQHLFCLRIVFFLLLSWRGANKKLGWEWARGVNVYKGLLQTNLPLLQTWQFRNVPNIHGRFCPLPPMLQPSYAYGPHASFAILYVVLIFTFISCTRKSFNAVVGNSCCNGDWPNDREKRTGNVTEGRDRSRM